MNLSDLAKTRSVPYSTVRKYVNALAERELIYPEVGSRSVTIHDNDVEVFDELLRLVRSGISFRSALDRLSEKKISGKSDAVSYFRKIEKKIDSLEEENRKLREIVQVYLSRIESLESQIKELMPPRKKGGFWKIFKRRKKV